MTAVIVIYILFAVLMFGSVIYGMIEHARANQNGEDTRSAGQRCLDGIPQQPTRAEYIKKYHEKFGG